MFLMNYWKQIVMALSAVALIVAVSYVWWLKNSLDKSQREIETLKGSLVVLQGDLNNARTRTQIDDTVRRSDDPTRQLRERFSRPSE
jgi:membrane protein implicated in regulation of membrane protease activity